MNISVYIALYELIWHFVNWSIYGWNFYVEKMKIIIDSQKIIDKVYLHVGECMSWVCVKYRNVL